MRKSVLILLSLLVFYLLFVVYAYRALYFSRFDNVYWKDKYEQSQWKLPLSQRTIGDDGLYLYEGFRLLHGSDPSLSNAEMPPLGKYLIGSSILLFGNGHWYGFLMVLITLFSTFMIGTVLFGSLLPALGVTLLVATDPLMTNQYPLTMMDALQSALLTLAIALVVRLPLRIRHESGYIVAIGIIVGLFSGAKLAVLTPVIAFIFCLFIWMTTKRFRNPLLFLLGIGAGYLIPYIPYFLLGHSVLDWLKLQKWIVSFYTNSRLIPTWGSALMTVFIGKYQNIFSRGWLAASEWSLLWPILGVSAAVGFFRWIKDANRSRSYGIVIFLFIISLGVYSATPFWTRYLVSILPLLYLSGAYVLSKKNSVMWNALFVIFLGVNLIPSMHILFPPPAASVNQFTYQMEHKLFPDIYEDVTNGAKRKLSRSAFTEFALSTLLDGEIEYIHLQPTKMMFTHRNIYMVTATVTYGTRNLGTFTRVLTIPFVREENRWRIPWDWDLLLPNLTETRSLHTTIQTAKRGTIVGSDKKPLAEDVPGYLVSVTPNGIDKKREDALLSSLETVFDGTLPKVAIHQRIVGGTLSTRPVPIGVIPHAADDPNIVLLKTFPGIELTPALTRITHPNHVVDIGELKNTSYPECCSRIYSTTNYDGISGVELKKNRELKGYNGGSLVLRDENGAVIDTFITRQVVEGKNVQP